MKKKGKRYFYFSEKQKAKMIYAQELESEKMLLAKEANSAATATMGNQVDLESNQCERLKQCRRRRTCGFLVWPVINLMLFGIFG